MWERKTIKRWSEHDNPTKEFELATYLIKHIDYVITLKILCQASKKAHIRKNLKVKFIALLKPSLNDQKNFEHLILFRNGMA